MRGKIVVVTGASGALGRAVAALAQHQGAKVASIDAAPASAPADPLSFAGIDLTNEAAATATMAAIRERAGRIDALLNIAGGFTWRTLEQGDADVWEKMFILNLKTAMLASKAALAHLIESQGAIVNVGAFAALKAGAGMGAYAASKSSVHKLTESLAEELKGRVRVNAVLPSTLDTPANRASMPDADPSLWVKPEDLARVMLFLASDAANAVTGVLVPVTGRS